jgi:hypothetical protein
MADSKRNDLVVRSSSEIVGTERRTPRVIEQMVRDVLVRATSQAVSSPRFYIGDTALREPDYRQILRWAEATEQTAESLLAKLKVSRIEPDADFGAVWPAVAFVLADGAMTSLVWDHDLLPRLPDIWEPGLLIQKLAVKEQEVVNDDDPFTLRPNLPNLRTLICKRPTHPPTAVNPTYASLPLFQGEGRWRHGKGRNIGGSRLKAGGKAG